MQKLYTKHYTTKILNTKKLKINNKIFIGFKINDLFKIKNYILHIFDYPNKEIHN